jgi:hypothetical protein
MRIALLAALSVGCGRATFHPTTPQTYLPIADHAVIVDQKRAAPISRQGVRVGTIATSGNGLQDQGDLANQAAVVAGKHGGTHVITTGSGVEISTSTTPASQTTTCTDYTDATTCTTSYTPESTTTTSTPWANFDVYRIEPTRWRELPGELRPQLFDRSHHTPTRNDGSGETVGYFTAPYPGRLVGTSGTVFPTAYDAEPSQAQGGWFSLSYEHESNVLAFDSMLGAGSLRGTASNTSQRTPPVSYTLDFKAARLGVRAGQRIAFDHVALAAGVGITGALFIGAPRVDPDVPTQYMFVDPPHFVVDVALPVWASLTVKPSCSWGVEGLAEYDERPFTGGAASPAFALGFVYQPATACL